MIYSCFIGTKVAFTTKLHPFGYIGIIFSTRPRSPWLDNNVCNFARNILLLQASPDTKQVINLVFGRYGIDFLLYGKVKEISELGSRKGSLIKRVSCLVDLLWSTNIGTICSFFIFYFLQNSRNQIKRRECINYPVTNQRRIYSRSQIISIERIKCFDLVVSPRCK